MATVAAGRSTCAGPLVAEVEGHLRALLRDVLCGYLDTDLKRVADDILLETPASPPRRSACATCASRSPSPSGSPTSPSRSRRAGARGRGDTAELEPVQPALEGVTASADWDDYSAPV